MIYETMRVPAKPRGGALPTYQRQGKIHAPGAGVNVRMDDSAARIAGAGDAAQARALAGLGQAIQGAADVGLKAYDDYQTVKATEGYNAFQQAMNDKLYGENGIFTRQGEAAFGSAEDMERAISETREDVARQLGLSDVARQKLGKQVFAYGLQFVPKAQKHAADERKKWADGQDQASLELNLEGFLNNPNDTQARLMYLSTMQQSYRQYADRNGLGAEQRELGWKKILSAAYSQLADKYITAGDLNAARKLVADDPLWMEGDQDKIRAKIQARAEALQAEAEKRRKQALEREIQTMSDALVRAVQLLPPEDVAGREHLLMEMAAQIQDPELRDKALSGANLEIAFNKRRFEAGQDAVTAEFNTPESRSMSPAERTARLNQYLNERRITPQTYDALNKSINGGPTNTYPVAFNTYMDMATGTRSDGTPWYTTETELRTAMTEANTVTLADQDKIVRAWQETRKAESAAATAREKAEADAYKEARTVFLGNLKALGVDAEKTMYAQVYFDERFDEFREEKGRRPSLQEMLFMGEAAVKEVWTGQKSTFGSKIEMPLYEAAAMIPTQARREIVEELLMQGWDPEDITEELIVQEYNRADNEAARLKMLQSGGVSGPVGMAGGI